MLLGAALLIPPLAAAAGPPEGATTSRIPMRVRFGETDQMGIVHHGSYLLYVEQARVEFLMRRGVSYADWAARDIHLPVVDARVRYRVAAVFPDLLEIETWVGELTRVSLRFDYRVMRGTTVLAEAYTTLACVDGQRTPRRMPPEVVEALQRPELG